MAGPLKDIKVLDLSRVLAGPWAGQLLADLGADVTKVEHPKGGDDTRAWGPPYFKDADGNDTAESAYYLSANRGKRSIAVDISKPEGQAVVHRLAEQADIVLENFKVGGLKKYNLDYVSIKATNPSILYCSITGFGQDGPYAKRAGYDFMIQAMGGLMSVTGVPEGEPGAGPQKLGIAISDLATGLYGVIGLLAALHHRTATGEGQHIDMSLMDVTVGLLANQNMNYLVGGTSPKRMGNAHLNIVPYQDFETADGHMILAAGNDRQFQAFLSVAGKKGAALAGDPRFTTNPLRVENRAALVPKLADIMRGKATAEWLGILDEVKVPCGPINTIEQVHADPQMIHRGIKVDIPHPDGGTVPQVTTPIKFSETHLSYTKAPPKLAEDTDALLTEAGYSAEEIAEMRASGFVA